jgi:hypothetical protein
MKRKRLLMLVLSVVILTLIGIGIRREWKRQAREKREIEYQSALHSYSQLLKVGMTRKEVEDYLRTKNAQFSQMCCVDSKEMRKGIWDDLTRVGEEDPPWFCNHHSVYIAFQFIGQKREAAIWQADPSDTLKNISVYHQLETCL